MPDRTLLSGLRSAIEGYEIERALDPRCPSCGTDYTAGDRLIVRLEREPPATTWEPVTVVCADCGHHSLQPDERPAVERALVETELVATPLAQVLNGEHLELLDHTLPHS